MTCKKSSILKGIWQHVILVKLDDVKILGKTLFSVGCGVYKCYRLPMLTLQKPMARLTHIHEVIQLTAEMGSRSPRVSELYEVSNKLRA